MERKEKNQKERIQTIKRKTMKYSKGITLVSLVVTIIVLIILAGVSINLTLGEEGIFTLAKKAKENTELAQQEEQEKLNALYTELELNSKGEGGPDGNSYDAIEKLLDFKKAIANAIEEAGGKETSYESETNIFIDNIKGIVTEKTKDATATEADIAEGKTAYANGKKLTGNANTAIPVSSVIFKDGSGPWDFSKEFPNGEGFEINNCHLVVSALTGPTQLEVWAASNTGGGSSSTKATTSTTVNASITGTFNAIQGSLSLTYAMNNRR